MSMETATTSSPAAGLSAGLPAEASDSRKRILSDQSEATGHSPDTKKVIMSRGRVSMPSDDAPELEWNKTLFRKIEEMYTNYDELKKCMEFNNKELSQCRSEIADMKKEITELQSQLMLVEYEKEEFKSQCRILTESHIKSEISRREQNLVFEGINETYGENGHLLYNKIVQVLNHMMVFNGQGARVPITKVQRIGSFLRGHNRSVVCHFSRYSDVELIMTNRSQLPDRVFVREDFPPEIEDRRRILRPIFNKAKKMSEFKGKCRLTCDKLVLLGKTYTVAPVKNLDKLPDSLNPRIAAECYSIFYPRLPTYQFLFSILYV